MPHKTKENNEFLLKTSLQCVGLTKLLCAINHATEDLQQKLLVFQIWFVFWVNHAMEDLQVKITDSPNMVCMINHAMEDCSIEYYILLQILLISLPCKNGKNKERLRWLREQYRVRRGKQKSNRNPDWQDRGNMTDIDIHCTCKGLL